MADRPHPIESARKLRGWSAAELARRAGLSEAAISRYESGARRPNTDAVAKLARALGLPLAEHLAPWIEEKA